MNVKFSEVLEAIKGAGDDVNYYYDKKTQTISFTSEYDDEEADDIEDDFDSHIMLPSKYDINDYHIMEEFIWNLKDEGQQSQLENAINGRGAFHYFRNLVDQFGITQEWYDFQDATYKNIACAWCEENKLNIIDK
ncbi:hypothetical protein D1B17_06470 [Companilactobacillus zhachilii]|uniref:Uncharacterized protein n=1 Tax=Companilactobacillus zhachilii TaxID=2304606 RepID=A0A386PTW7_9LACO|nr:UPF0158 family protein [Companilactobacillus zhachilii]AYE38295.1 hypothetical protein D1B17_06470 [Companilactobacillus zhachilii]